MAGAKNNHRRANGKNVVVDSSVLSDEDIQWMKENVFNDGDNVVTLTHGDGNTSSILILVGKVLTHIDIPAVAVAAA